MEISVPEQITGILSKTFGFFLYIAAGQLAAFLAFLFYLVCLKAYQTITRSGD